jgi:putative RNA 2'-phosphotransferase
MRDRTVKVSKFLSLVLRHKPEQIGLKLNAEGWASVRQLLRACNAHGFPLSYEELEEVVAANDKKRFSFNPNGQLIRANQGHSVNVELGYKPIEPPEVLYHGTADRFLNSIKREGIVKGRRHHVHLSKDISTATKVGQRHGKVIVLEVDSRRMQIDGHNFYLSENGVWLTEYVQPEYIRGVVKVVS